MSRPFHQTKEFITLNEQWAKKLKDSGFQDIEYNDELFITGHRPGVGGEMDDRTASIYKSKSIYYRLAGQFLYSHKFTNEAEKSIWAMHSENISFRIIAKTLRGEKKWNKDNISAIITRLSKKMLLDYKKEVDEDEQE